MTVHIDIRVFDANEINSNIEQWLNDRWKRKDELLNYFIKNNKFPENKSGNGSYITKPHNSIYSLMILFTSLCFYILFVTCIIYYFFTFVINI